MKQGHRGGSRRGAASRLAAGCVALGLTIGTTQLAGCVGYANYPPIDGNIATENPNSGVMFDIMIAGLDWVSSRYSPQGEYAVNFPEGITRTRALQVLTRVGDPDAHILTEETASLPIYHITRIWVRGERAEMDVLRPVVDLLNPDGQAAYQPLTLIITGGLKKWHMKSFRTWTIDSQSPPPLNFLDAPHTEGEATAPASVEKDEEESPVPPTDDPVQ